jgi:hypothetical protein
MQLGAGVTLPLQLLGVMMTPDQRLKNGATVLAYKFAGGYKTVLAHWQSHHLPYVTWRADADGNTYLGHYFKTESEAQADFQTR